MNSKEKGVASLFIAVIAAILVAVIALSALGVGANINDAEKTGDVPKTTQHNTTQAAQQQESTTPTEKSGSISIDEAKAIALKDSAQQDNNSIVFTKEKLDSKNGVSFYKIEFTDLINEYEYKINTSNGEIISKSTEAYDND